MKQTFEPLPAIPKEIWDELRKLEALQNAITAAQLQIIRKPGDRTAKGIEDARKQWNRNS